MSNRVKARRTVLDEERVLWEGVANGYYTSVATTSTVDLFIDPICTPDLVGVQLVSEDGRPIPGSERGALRHAV